MPVRPSLALLCCFALFGMHALAGAAAPIESPGKIKIFTATGGAQWRGADSRTVPLAHDQVVTEGGAFLCGSGASAFVVFSNGALLLLQPDTELAVVRFRQAPFAEARTYLSLARNPSPSRLELQLRAGTVIMAVLASDAAAAGSSFVLRTAAGAITTPGGTFFLSATPAKAPEVTTVVVKCLRGALEFLPAQPLGVPLTVGPAPVALAPGGGVQAQVKNSPAGAVLALEILGLAVPRGETQKALYDLSAALTKAITPQSTYSGPYQQPWADEPSPPRDLPLLPSTSPDTYHPAGSTVP